MKKNRTITYQQAINEALHQEMARDPRVFTYGIDVGDHKRIFGTTAGLSEKFGNNRCFSTPLCEESMLGFGLGSAMVGLRPIHVHMRVDFLLLAMNQLINMIASASYGSAGALRVPIVIRAIIGRGWGQGFQHSKSLQSVFSHIPGLKVVMPTTPADAKGLLIAAIREDNPVIVIEHRWLYYQEGEVAENAFALPLDKAQVLRKGKDVTIVATSWMNVEAHHAARVLQERGIDAEIIDARAIAPLDEETIVNSVKKTGRCIVADYDWTYCGFSAEIAAVVSKKCFSALKYPVERIGFADVHCPTARSLENGFYPNAGTIIRTVEKMFDLPPANFSKEQFYSHEHKFKGPF